MKRRTFLGAIGAAVAAFFAPAASAERHYVVIAHAGRQEMSTFEVGRYESFRFIPSHDEAAKVFARHLAKEVSRKSYFRTLPRKDWWWASR